MVFITDSFFTELQNKRPMSLKTITLENDNPVWFWLVKGGALIKENANDPRYEGSLRIHSFPHYAERPDYRLGVGRHRLHWKEEVFEVEITELDGSREKAVVYVEGDGEREFYEFLTYMREMMKRKNRTDKEKIIVKTFSDSCWTKVTSYPKRYPETVKTGDTSVTDLLEDIKMFYRAEDDYINFGRPFKRNILLRGPPGSGKSSTINVVASEFDLDIYFLTFTAGMRESSLGPILSSISDNALLVLEDIDTICISSQESNSGSLTHSILTNILDGTLHKHKLVTIMTTTKPDCVDDILSRKGRVDYVCDFSSLNNKQIEEMVSMVWCDEKESRKLSQRIQNEVSYREDITSTVLSEFIFNNRSKSPEEVDVKQLSDCKESSSMPPSNMFM